MSLRDVHEFLDHELPNFLRPALARTRELRDAPGLANWERKLYEGWIDYFEELASKNTVIRTWSGQRLHQTLDAEASALAALETLLSTEANLHAKAGPLVAALTRVIRIEREATEMMRDEI